MCGQMCGGDLPSTQRAAELARQRHSAWFIAVQVALFVLAEGALAATAPVRLVLVSTPKHNAEMRVVDGRLEDRPGHQIDLLREAGKRCGAAVEFQFFPWQRALLMVEHGEADGAFSSSYDPQRTIYGVYPMADGKPDASRALKGYSYSLYVPRDSGPTWDGRAVVGADGKVVVERGASVIPRVGELGLSYVEVADNETMLRMVAGKRVAAAAVMTAAADTLLAELPELAAAVTKREPPLEEKFGYVMLSKTFYASHPDVAECFWMAIRDIRATPQHAELVRSYLAETP